MIMSGHDLGKIKLASPPTPLPPPRLSTPANKRTPSSPKFEISAPGANSKIYGICLGEVLVVFHDDNGL